MKKKKDIKKVIKKIEKSGDSKFYKQKNNNEIDLWKEIRTNLKPLVKAYNKFSEKRRVAKKKEEEKKIKEAEKQRLREEEFLRLQEQEEKRLKRQKNIKEEKERRLQAQEEERLEEKRIKDEYAEQIRQEQIYRERLAKGEEERIKQFKAVKESREEEKKLRDKRNLDNADKLIEKQDPQKIGNRLKDLEEQLKEEEHRLKEKEQRLKEEEQMLKEEVQKLKNDKKINLKVEKESYSDHNQEKKRLNGAVLWFNDTKGYGFIKREDKEKDVFVHFSAVQNSGLTNLKENEQLTFEIEYSNKGPSAINLQKTSNEASYSHLKLVK